MPEILGSFMEAPIGNWKADRAGNAEILPQSVRCFSIRCRSL